MSAVVFLVIMVVVGVAGTLFATDSRHSHDPIDRYWWPNR
jgi:hypothetical protein